MTEYKSIKIEKREGRTDIVLNSPPLNILTIAMMKEISSAIEEIIKDKTLRALIFRAEGKHFSAGADVAEHTKDKVNDMITAFGGMFRAIAKVPAVTIALVDGSALGGGCELATFCDIVLASDRAKFGQPEIQVGVFPPVAVVIFPYLVGRNRALELLITGKVIPAQEAEAMGLINHTFPAEEFLSKTEEFIAKITALSAPVIAVTKRTLDKCRYLPVMQAFREADEIYFTDLMTTQDANEGLTAFLEKRKPIWKNR
jgi:cyclohexa-1,5-dienecarbonyl-CoA hydratase